MSFRSIISTAALCLGFFAIQAQDSTSNKAKVEAPQFDDVALEFKSKIDIYPNPAVSFLIVEIKNSRLDHIEFEMRSIIGNKVKIIPEDMGGDKYRINVKEFDTGYYFLVVKDEFTKFKEAHKFLKK